MLVSRSEQAWQAAAPVAVLLALCLLVLYASPITVVSAFLILGLYTLVIYGRRVWRWWLPGVLAGPIALLDIASSKLRLTGSHSGVLRPPLSIPLPQAMVEFFTYFTGVSVIPIIWLALLVVATGFALRNRNRAGRSRALYWLLLALT